MLVKDIMREDVVTISPLATIREAMKRMKDHGVKSLVVEKQGPHDAYGIITYTTILRTIVAEEGDIDLINVYDVCTKPVISVSGELECKHVAQLMVRQQFRRVVVLKDNELRGIITRNDIVRPILEIAEQ
ncbi:CBS domain-containing protein [Alkalilimnicola ehrlichii MLHE-1]|uniref:Putative signal-transduction protein with CBS domains n=1 Tax=Alkalilimnicola ehrlichii (strain ATCC BAA-1101 / DSM 17681 / MLHE-1) TaxID=187272 RepID=Q0AAX2_ALKEH|nr:CBS domain-containing protein [Alkalilimnicola ehrlichii]ABI56015.1 putative signal-transduction protein with CBS domains [Alkalilimnicola ehrlichii MLHE-1]